MTSSAALVLHGDKILVGQINTRNEILILAFLRIFIVDQPTVHLKTH